MGFRNLVGLVSIMVAVLAVASLSLPSVEGEESSQETSTEVTDGTMVDESAPMVETVALIMWILTSGSVKLTQVFSLRIWITNALAVIAFLLLLFVTQMIPSGTSGEGTIHPLELWLVTIWIMGWFAVDLVDGLIQLEDKFVG